MCEVKDQRQRFTFAAECISNAIPRWKKPFSALEGPANPHYGAALTEYPLTWMKLIVARVLCINVNHR